MAKIAITADIHCGVPGRLQDILWSLRVLREYCHRTNIDVVLVLGDLFHDRSSLDIEVLVAVCDFFEETATKYGQQWITFPGNHDMFLRHSWDITSISIMRKYLTVIDTIKILEIAARRFWILPFITYEKSFMKVLHKIEEQHKEGDILLTHIGVNKAILNTCFLLKEWSLVTFENSPFQTVYTGHFHSKQKIGENLWYPGSLIPFKFDEGDIAHGFYVYDTEDGTHKFADIWKAGEKLFPDEIAPPQFRTIQDTELNTITSEDMKNNIVRISFTKDYSDDEKQEMKKHVDSLGARTIRLKNYKSKDEYELKSKDPIFRANLFNIWLETDINGTKNLSHSLLRQINEEITREGDEKYVVEESEI